MTVFTSNCSGENSYKLRWQKIFDPSHCVPPNLAHDFACRVWHMPMTCMLKIRDVLVRQIRNLY
jgi:hypothetical protein